MNKNLLIVLGIFLAVIIVGVFLMGRPKTQPVAVETPSPAASDSGTIEEGDIREISISASEYSFNPLSLSLNKGEKVRLTVTNNGRMQHDLVIEELNLGTEMLTRGESGVIEFTVPESGELTYFCSVSNHRALGMEGKITIKE